MEFGGEMNNPAVGGDAHIAPRENVPITTCFRRNHTMYNGPMWASAPTARSDKFQFSGIPHEKTAPQNVGQVDIQA